MVAVWPPGFVGCDTDVSCYLIVTRTSEEEDTNSADTRSGPTSSVMVLLREDSICPLSLTGHECDSNTDADLVMSIARANHSQRSVPLFMPLLMSNYVDNASTRSHPNFTVSNRRVLPGVPCGFQTPTLHTWARAGGAGGVAYRGVLSAPWLLRTACALLGHTQKPTEPDTKALPNSQEEWATDYMELEADLQRSAGGCSGKATAALATARTVAQMLSFDFMLFLLSSGMFREGMLPSALENQSACPTLLVCSIRMAMRSEMYTAYAEDRQPLAMAQESLESACRPIGTRGRGGRLLAIDTVIDMAYQRARRFTEDLSSVQKRSEASTKHPHGDMCAEYDGASTPFELDANVGFLARAGMEVIRAQFGRGPATNGIWCAGDGEKEDSEQVEADDTAGVEAADASSVLDDCMPCSSLYERRRCLLELCNQVEQRLRTRPRSVDSGDTMLNTLLSAIQHIEQQEKSTSTTSTTSATSNASGSEQSHVNLETSAVSAAADLLEKCMLLGPMGITRYCGLTVSLVAPNTGASCANQKCDATIPAWRSVFPLGTMASCAHCGKPLCDACQHSQKIAPFFCSSCTTQYAAR